MTLDALTTSLSSLPPLFWPAVIAALITAALAFAGVLVSNRSNTNRLRAQLQHDANEKSKERISQMRRSVYLQAAAEMSKALAHLGNIPQLDPRTENLGAPLLAFNSVAAQIQMIAESHTADLFAEVGKRLTAVYFDLIAKAQPMFELKFKAEMHESMRTFAQREFDQLITEGKALEVSPETLMRHERIRQSIGLYQTEIEAQGNLITECFDKRLELQRQYALELMEKTAPIIEAQLPLMVEIRKELELSSDISDLNKRARVGFADFKVMLERALDH